MSLVERLRARTPAAVPIALPRPPRRADALFVAVLVLLIAVHATIFTATLIVAPVTSAEQQSLVLLHLPVEVARALTLPFDVLLLVSLYRLGTRAAGRWAGLAAIFAVLALDLRADPSAVVYGPSIATGGWAAAALLATALAVVARRPLLAAVLLGAAAVFHGLAALALPAFLIALLLVPAGARRGRLGRMPDLARFAGAWALPFAAGQLVWLRSIGPDAWLARTAAFTAEFAPHGLVPWLEQQRIVFSAWHFPVAFTVAAAAFLFVVASVGLARYFAVPVPGERGGGVLVVLRRLPVELWAAGLTFALFGAWWAFSGAVAVVDPNLPVMVGVVPLITAMAYRGAKWLLTVNRFWRLAAVVYLVGLVLARSTQLGLTLVQAFQR